MSVSISVTVNGRLYQEEVEPRLLLVDFLRDVLELTGTHVGCDTSSCGACTIVVNDKAVKSCTLLAVQADGADVTTIEGLASNGELHPLQQGFHEEHGLQCGFCTPGMIMAAWQLLERNPDPSDAEIRHAWRATSAAARGMRTSSGRCATRPPARRRGGTGDG